MERNAKRGSALWAVVWAGAIWGAGGAGLVPARAQRTPLVTSAQKTPAVASAASPSDQEIAIVDAQRGALDRFLDAHPDIEQTVVNNPEVIRIPKYLHMYPELQAFLDSHPLVKADPRAFLSPLAQHPRWALDVFDVLKVYFLFGGPLLAFLWVLRTMVEVRRWNRSFKMHEDVQTKLIEKFASGQDVNAYLQSDAGRRLLEWTPHVLDTPSRGLPNPLGRIFWSVQTGLVLLLVGLGLLLIRGQMAESSAPPLLVFGTLGVTLGAGFILAAVVSYGLSKRLGLIAGVVQGSDPARKS